MHYNVPRFWAELGVGEGSKLWTFSTILILCFGFVLVCYEGVALSGYLLFGSAINGNPNPVNSKGDILLNFNFTPDVQLARVALVLTQILNFPIVFNSHRASVASILPASWQPALAGESKGKGWGSTGLTEKDDEEEGDTLELLLGGASSRVVGTPTCLSVAFLKREGPHALLTFTLIILSVLCAVLIPNLSTILGVKGATGGVLLVYILPALMHFTLVRRRFGFDRTITVGKGSPLRTPSSLTAHFEGSPPTGVVTLEEAVGRTPSPLAFREENSPSEGWGGESSQGTSSPGTEVREAWREKEGWGSFARELCFTWHGKALLGYCVWGTMILSFGLLKYLTNVLN